MTEFEKVFEENRDLVFRYLLKLCRNNDLADELTQETFFRAYVNFAGIRSKGHCSTWLCQTAKNCYFAWYNGQKRLAPLEDDLASAPDPAELAETRELTEKASRLLDELGEPYNTVFRLAVVEEMPLKEISLLYGKSKSWARVTYYRAKQRLAERMEK